MLSRTAERIYWFGRYAQRAENTARLVSVHDHLALDLPRRLPLSWVSLVEILGADASYRRLYEGESEAEVVQFLLGDERFSGSLSTTLASARENLRATREIMPSEVWEKLNALHGLTAARAESVAYRRPRADLLASVIEGCQTIVGMLVSNMSRGEAFHFLRLGMALEQADMTTRIIDVRSGGMVAEGEYDELGPFRNIQWMSVLKSLTAYQAYRRKQRTRVSGPAALRFLLQDSDFPRSVAFCLSSMQQTLPRLPAHPPVETAVSEASRLVAACDVTALLSDGLDHSLAQTLDDIQLAIGAAHEALAEAFFRLEAQPHPS